MQGIGLARRKRLNKYFVLTISIFVLLLLVAVDQLTKLYFRNNFQDGSVVTIIENFFIFKFAKNTGAAWSLFADKDWSQLFFKILTIVSLVLFVLLFIFAYIKNHRFLQFSIAVVIAGTLGNFLDRIIFGYVTDFISFQFGSYYFPIFNVADICLTIGVIMVFVHFVFLDGHSKKNKKSNDNEN